MSKTKSPLMSFEAHGSIARTLTFQKQADRTTIRHRPIPANPRTLLQTYERWLYKDYADLWHALTTAAKAAYETAARPHHMTGFAYYMKISLLTLPHNVLFYHMDDAYGAPIHDFSKNLYHGTAYFSVPYLGIIDRARTFNGSSSYIDCGTAPKANFTTGDFTISCFLNPPSLKESALICRGFNDTDGFYISTTTTGAIFANFAAPADNQYLWTPINTLVVGTWQHLSFTLTNHVAKMFLNGTDVTLSSAINRNPTSSSRNLLLGKYETPVLYFEGLIDHLNIWNISLPEATLARQAQQHYPL